MLVKNREQHDFFEFYYPGEKEKITECDNEKSLLVSFSLCQKRILLTGDIEHKGIDIFLKKYKKKLDILQIPHHGSFIKNTSHFIKTLSPSYAFVSSNQKFPHPPTLKKYENANICLLKTYKHGAITFSFSAQKINIFFFRDSS